MDVNTLANILVAAAAIITIGITLFMWFYNLKRQEDDKWRSWFLDYKKEASFVDAYIGMFTKDKNEGEQGINNSAVREILRKYEDYNGKINERCIIIHNASPSPIHDVVIDVITKSNKSKTTCFDTIAPGLSMVIYKEDMKGYPWDYPRVIDQEFFIQNIIPQALGTKKYSWQIDCLAFTDTHGNRWERIRSEIEIDKKPVSLTCLKLVDTQEARLKKFVSKINR